jgi:gliding motility-associated-like protein
MLSSPDSLEANLQVLANPTCNGINDGVITSLTSGGTGIYSYNWSSNFSTTNIINSLSVGLYNVIVSDNNGCSISDSILLDPVYTLNNTMTSTQVTCTGSSDGTATITMLGGTSPYTYQWNNGLSTATITGLFAGSYNITVTDASGCILIDTVEVTESDSVLAVTAIVSDLSCFQDNSGTVSVSVSGGTGAYNYSWSNGETTSLISNLNAATYQLDVTDAAGCIVSNSFIVSEPLDLVYTLSSEDITCFGLSDGFTNLTVSGGTLPYNYNWSGPTNYASTDSSIDYLNQGSYSIVVTDSNNCFVTDSVSISEPTPLVSVVDYSDPLCFNSSDGSIDINVHGGIGPYTSSFGLFSPTVILPDSIFYQNLSSGSNILSVYDANNCENSYTITLINPLELIIDNISTANPSCYNYSNGAASINVVGGTLPYVYQLLDNNNNVLTGSSNSIYLSSGSYIYLVTDKNGCDDTLSFNINNVDEISINPSSIIDVNCYGENTGSIEVNISNANGSYELVWMPNQSNTNSELITDLSAGKYTAVVVDELGCTKIDSFFVNENENIEVDFTAINSSCKLNADGQININNIIGGVGPFSIYNNSDLVASNIFDSYTIESLKTTDDISPYNLVVLDNYNCQFNTSVDIGFDGGYGCIDEPIIITPNYDGYNDTWIPILDLNTDIEVSILNRWGEKEFHWVGNSLMFSWDGLANWGKDHQLPSSDYYYIIEFTNDNYPAKTGVITLIR